jgi:hypothetical protein
MKALKWIVGLVAVMVAAYLFVTRTSSGAMLKDKLFAFAGKASDAGSPRGSITGAEVTTPEILGTPDNMQTVQPFATTSRPGTAKKK